MKVIFQKSNISGKVKICPSKSYEQRVLGISALTDNNVIIENIGNSEDVMFCRKIIEQLGCKIDISQTNATISHTGVSQYNTYNCGESAFCARFFPPIISTFKKDFEIIGQGSLLTRNILPDFADLNWKIDSTDKHLPFHFYDAELKSDVYEINASHSSQVISGLIIALSKTEGHQKLIIRNAVSINYILLTIEIANISGATISHKIINKDIIVEIDGCKSFKRDHFVIEGDWSNAAYFIALGLIYGNVAVSGLNKDSLQADKKILTLLKEINANITFKDDTLYVGKTEYKGFSFDATNCPDLIPAIISIALFAKDQCKIKGMNRLIDKESNRKDVIIEILQTLNTPISIDNDSLIITPANKYGNIVFNSHNDHRIAMMESIIALNSNSEIEISDCGCIKKSYPDFFNDLKKIGAQFYFKN